MTLPSDARCRVPYLGLGNMVVLTAAASFTACGGGGNTAIALDTTPWTWALPAG
ncbi:hypothetical protein [Ottowia sp.]|uniref:hypothetical protein n=1 Tax=Ottowia sp. TaxID=1898956 RepID=UPI002626E688|nr:hypothetical protein [Ottowia sp.]